MAETYSAGVVTAYGAAVRGGYTGTYEEFCAEQADFAENAAAVAQAKADVETMQGQVEQAAATFTGTTVPAAVATVQAEGATQVQAVQSEGTMQAAAVETVGAQQTAAVGAAGSDAVDAVEAAETAATGAVAAAQTAAVQAVQTESTTQQAAIQTKGEETIASIPADYTALSGEVDDLKSAINLNKITLQKNTCTNLQNPLTQITYNGFSSAVVPCVPGEHFQIKGFGGNGSRLWIFADANGTSLTYASANTDQSESYAEITAPNNAAYLSVNNNDSETEMQLFRGVFIADEVEQLNSEMLTKTASIGKNIIGSESGVYYPIEQYALSEGQALTISTSDGTAFGTDAYGRQINLIFSDEAYNQLAYWGLSAAISARTITLNQNAAKAKYVSLSGTPQKAVQLEKGTSKTDYEPYYPPIDDIASYTVEANSDVSTIHLHDRNIVEVAKKHATSDGLAENAIKILWASDIHNERQRVKRMVELMNSWGETYLDIAINTGDTVATLYSQGLNWYDALVTDSDIPVLNTVGNHDAYATLAPATLVDKVDVYNMVIAPVAAQTVIVQPSNAATLGLNYYYKDVNGIRIVVLDCMYWTTDQEAWFANVLSDAVSNSLPVIAVSHAPFAQQYSELLDTIWNDSSFVRDGTLMNYAAAQCVDTFISSGGTFLCWMQGHIHGDEIYKLPNNSNQLCICVDGFGPRGTKLIKNTEIASYNYDCLTFLTVDTANSLIKLYRVGANVDRNGMKHNMFTWNYVNKTIVSEW